MKPERCPLVSIVIPAFNATKYIDQAIESVLAQTYSNVEIIVLDDGSTDGTRGVIDNYRDRCIVDGHLNVGQAATLNRGWERARGDFLGYLSADDMLEPDAIEVAVKYLLECSGVALVYPNYALIDEASRTIRDVDVPDYSYDMIVYEGQCPTGPGVIFRRSLFVETGGWDSALRQIPDYEFLLRVGLHGTCAKIDKVLARFRVHDESQTFASSDGKKAEEYVYALDKYFALPTVPAEIRANRRLVYASGYILTARLHLRSGRPGSALAYVVKALQMSCSTVFRRRSIRLLANGACGRSLHRLRQVLAARR